MHEILKRVAPDFINNIRELNKRELKKMSEEINRIKRFPIDCSTDCPHFYCLASEFGEGISFVCNLKNVQMHSSMIHYYGKFLPFCPLEEIK